ncbi:MAG: BON domain-containing protein [Novosphingobium sp.]
MADFYRERPDYRGSDDERRERERRWQRGAERYRGEAAGGQDGAGFEDDRGDTYDAPWNGRGYAQRTYYAPRDYGGRQDSRPMHWHERNRELRAGHPYEGTYGGSGDSSWFTGTQGSWALGEYETPRPYHGGQRFGADYRAHGYARGDERRGLWDRASDEVASWFGDEDAARRREEDHRGRGPRDYIRSDERIREDANDRLTDDARVDASNVTVAVDKCEVTLNGTVTSRQAKRRAEDLVDAISGVKHVQNNLRVETVAGSGGAYTGNRVTSATAPAEGGTISPASRQPAGQASKI